MKKVNGVSLKITKCFAMYTVHSVLPVDIGTSVGVTFLT